MGSVTASEMPGLGDQVGEAHAPVEVQFRLDGTPEKGKATFFSPLLSLNSGENGSGIAVSPLPSNTIWEESNRGERKAES